MNFKKIILVIIISIGLVFLINKGDRKKKIIEDLAMDYRKEEALELLDQASLEKNRFRLSDFDYIYTYEKLACYKELEDFYLGRIDKLDRGQEAEFNREEYEDWLVDFYLDHDLEKAGAYFLSGELGEDPSQIDRIYRYYSLSGLDIPEKYLDLFHRKGEFGYLLDYYISQGSLEKAEKIVLEEELVYKDEFGNQIERLKLESFIGLIKTMKAEKMDYEPVLLKFEKTYAGNSYFKQYRDDFTVRNQGDLKRLLKILEFYRSENLDSSNFRRDLVLAGEWKAIVKSYLEGKIEGEIKELKYYSINKNTERYLLITEAGDLTRLYLFNELGNLLESDYYKGRYKRDINSFEDLFTENERDYIILKDEDLSLLLVYESRGEIKTCLVEFRDDLIRKDGVLASSSLKKSLELTGFHREEDINFGVSDNIFIVETYYGDEESRKIEDIILREYRVLETGYLELIDLRPLKVDI